MNINALFVHKQTSAMHVVALTASTQEEFNAQLQTAYLEVVAMGWHSFSIETETFDGDEPLVQQWTGEFVPQEGSFEEISSEPQPLQNDHLQFARLLKELEMVGALTPAVMTQLSDSMDCSEAFITEVLERATCAFDDYVERTSGPSHKK